MQNLVSASQYCTTAYIKPFTQKDIVHMCGAKKEAKTLWRLRFFEVTFESLITFMISLMISTVAALISSMKNDKKKLRSS